MVSQTLFGTRRRTEVLLALALMEESHARELSQVLGAPLLSVQRIVKDLEAQGILVGRTVGRERRITFNPRYFGLAPLKELLLQMAMRDTDVDEAVANLRRRPRAQGKEI